MFEFLFKYSPVMFQEGAFGLKLLPSVVIMAGVVLTLAFLTWFAYRETTLPLNRALKAGLLTLKICVLLTLLLIAAEPFVSVSTVVPRRSSLIILADDSQSMTIRDAGSGLSRQAHMLKLLGDQTDDGLLHDLAGNFKLRLYKFASGVEPLPDPEQLSARGGITDVAASLSFASQLARQNAVSGVILLSDGVSTGPGDPLEVASELKAAKVPVYVVGIGDENIADIELAKVDVNHSVIENSVVALSALIKKTGIKDQKVDIELRENGLIIKDETVLLQGAATHTAMTFSPLKKGLTHYSLRVSSRVDEPIMQNNIKNFLVDNRDAHARVLYVEGYPRAEFKYLRRALDGDPNIELVSLLRTGPDKFYRQGIKSEDELKDGYPKSKEELFKYDAIIFGSIEADFFSDAEIANTLAFVSERGGGFLMIGGGQAFAQGGYAATELAKMLPVELHVVGRQDAPPLAFRDKYKLLLTPEGRRFPVLQLAQTESENVKVWDALPELEGYNSLGRAKPGATVLAVHPLSEAGNPKIIMAQQRYGRGRSMVFATSSSWLWQMGLPHQDMSHERFWRQVLRWLALNTPDAVECRTDKKNYAPGEKITVTVDVRDPEYVPIRNAVIRATVKTPSGKTMKIPFDWASNGKVHYLGHLRGNEKGIYRVEVEATASDRSFQGKSETAFIVEDAHAEFNNAQLQTAHLQRIAEVSGGKYYHQDEAHNLADEISVMESSYSKITQHDLWDMPVIFFLLLGLLSLEWFIRRSKGLS